MYQLLAKKGQLFAIGLGVSVVAIYLFTVLSGLSGAGYSVSDDLVTVLKSNNGETFDFFDLGLKITIALIFIALALALLFGLYQLLTNLKGSLTGLIGIAVIIGLFFALYSSANTDLEQGNAIVNTLQKFNITDNISKIIEGSLKTTIIMAIIAVASMFLLEIYNMFK